MKTIVDRPSMKIYRYDDLSEFCIIIYEVYAFGSKPWTIVQPDQFLDDDIDEEESIKKLFGDLQGIDQFPQRFLPWLWGAAMPGKGAWDPNNLSIVLADEPLVSREPAAIHIARIRESFQPAWHDHPRQE